MDANEAKIYQLFLISCMVVGAVLCLFIVTTAVLHGRQRRRYMAMLEQHLMLVEAERRRFAEYLHDDLAPLLTAAQMQLSAVAPGGDAAKMELAFDYIEQFMEQLRNMSRELVPKVLTDKGLVPAIEAYIFNLAPVAGMPKIHFSAAAVPELGNAGSVNVYRILQEIIYNTIKHAGAKELELTLSMEAGQVIIASTDDGAGFDYELELERSKGIGLRVIHERVQLMGGEIFIATPKGGGTRYYMRIPMNPS